MMFLGLYSLVALTTPSWADTWIVDPDPGGFDTIQAAVDMASDDDVIQVYPGTYLESIDLGAKALSLVGSSGAEATIIAGAGGDTETPLIQMDGASSMDGFTLAGAGYTCLQIERAVVSLSNMVFSDCGTVDDDAAGGVLVIDGDLTGENLEFDNNRAHQGAGLAVYGESTITLEGCTFEDGVATNGGGIYQEGGTLELHRVSFADNTADFGSGGAISTANTTIIATDLGLTGNEATYDGGAMALSGGSLEIDDLVASDNNAQFGDGGALQLIGVTITTANAWDLAENRAGEDGGGLFADLPGASGSFSALTAVDNQAVQSGGGVYFADGDFDVYDAQLIDNHTDGAGGAIHFAGTGSLALGESQISGNQAGTNGGGLFIGSAADPISTLSLTQVQLTENTATSDGGGANVFATDLMLSEVLLTSNQTTGANGGGLAWAGDTAAIYDSAFVGNEAWTGGGAVLDISTSLWLSSSVFQENTGGHTAGGLALGGTGIAEIVNNDFLGNATGDPDGVGNLSITGPEASVVNNIIAFATNGVGLSLDTTSAATSTIAYNDLFDNAGGDVGGAITDPTGVDGNISADPRLMAISFNGDFEDDDLFLRIESPCVGTGDPDVLSGDGHPSDIGAFGLSDDPPDVGDTGEAIDTGTPEDTDTGTPEDTATPWDTGEPIDTATPNDTGDTDPTPEDSGEDPDTPADSGEPTNPERGAGTPQDPASEDENLSAASGCRCSQGGGQIQNTIFWLVAGLLFGYRRRNKWPQ